MPFNWGPQNHSISMHQQDSEKAKGYMQVALQFLLVHELLCESVCGSQLARGPGSSTSKHQRPLRRGPWVHGHGQPVALPCPVSICQGSARNSLQDGFKLHGYIRYTPGRLRVIVLIVQ